MARLPAILRLSPKSALASNAAFFAKAVARAASKPPPPPPNPPPYSSSQVATPVQWNGGGTPLQQVHTTSNAPPSGYGVGYGVYSPEYLEQQLWLNAESPIHGPPVPEHFDSDFPDLDPLNRDDHFRPANNVEVDDEPVTDEAAIELAEELAEEIAEGRGLDLFQDNEVLQDSDNFEDTDLNRAEVIEQLEAGGYEVESSEWGLVGDNITRTTITDPESGETIHEYYDHDNDRYWVEVTDVDGKELSSSDVRDERGRKVTVSEDEETGGTTTRLEDDWGDGSTVEITVLPDSDVVTIKTTDGDGNSETVVIAEDGSQTVLEPEQETTREDVEEIVNGVADGQSIEEIAEEQGLTREQVIAQLAAIGFELEAAVEGEGPSYVSTTKITDQESGDVIASHETGPDGTKTSRVIDPDGNEVRRTESPDGSTTEVVIEPDGRETETTVDADGTTTTTVAYEQNGVTVEEVTVNDGETTTTIIDDDGTRTELEPEQETTREGIEDIAEAVANGQSIDEIAEGLGLTRDQIIAQLAAAGFQVSEWADSHDNVTRRIVDTQSGEDIARYHFSMESMARSTLHVDADGNETTRTEYMDGRSVETVVEDNGRKTVTNESADGDVTTRVTHNGYTVTTPPDGDITVRNDEDGTEIDVERGTYEASLVETLLGIDLDSSDAEEVLAAEIVMAAIEQLLAGEAVKGLQDKIDDKQKELDEVIEEHGPGHQPDTNVSFDNPYGNPPPGKAPSGGDWVPMYGLWMDPEVARATTALNILLAEQLEASGRAQYNQTQMDVFALDPEYEGAMERAGEILDEALAPHGMRWVRPEPDGSLTLEEARERQEAAETRHEEAGKAKESYREAQRLLERGITRQADIPTIDSVDICTGEESSEEIQAMAAEYRRDSDLREAAEDISRSFFFDAGSSISEGDERLASYTVSWLELQVELAEPGSEDHERLSDALEEAEKAEEDAGIQVEAAQAYRDFYAAKGEAGRLTIEAYESSDDLLAVFNEDKGILEEGKKFQTVGGKALGEFTGVQTIHEGEDGRLMVVTHFEHGTTEESLAPDEMSEWWENNRDPELTTQWLDLRDERQSADQTVNSAGEALQNTLERHLEIELESLETDIEGFEQELDELFERHEEGSAEVPDNLIPEGDEPQKISVGDHELLVTSPMAEEYEERGLEVLIGSDQPVGIEIDGEWLWVHPEIAMTSIALDIAKEREEQQRPLLEAAQDAVRDQAVRYALMTDEPMQRMGESDADFMGRLEYGYLEGDNRDKALDGLYQPLFQDLKDQGFDSEFSVRSSDASLNRMIEDTFGLNGKTDDGQEAIDDILGEIRDIGGDSPEVKAVPLFHVGHNEGVSQVMLLAVRGEEGETRYIDITGRHYSDLENFRDKNRMFSEDGLLVAPRDLEMRSDASGDIPLEVVAASKSSDWETVVDPLIGIGTGVATVLMFTPAAPVAAPFAVAGGLYLGGRAAYHQWDHMRHGGEWNDFESAMNYLSVATTALPIGAGAIRAFNIRSVLSSAPYNVSMTRGQAFMSSIGAVKPNSTLAQNATLYMSSAGGWNRTARVLDWGAIGTGVPLMGMAAQQLIVHGDQMTDLQKTDAFVGLMTGFAGTGLGAQGLMATNPGRFDSQPIATKQAQPGGIVNRLSSAEQLSMHMPYMQHAMSSIDPIALQNQLIKKGVTPEVAKSFSEQVNSMGSEGFPSITLHDIALKSGDVNSVSKLTPGQFSEFSASQINQMSPEKMRTIRASQINALSDVQLGGIHPHQIAELDPRVVGKISPEKFSAMTSEQRGNLPEGSEIKSVQLEGLSDIQLAEMPLEQIAALDPRVMRSLSTKKFSVLSPDQLAYLTVDQRRGLQSEKLESLSEAQRSPIDLLDRMLNKGISPEEARNKVIFRHSFGFTPYQIANNSAAETAVAAIAASGLAVGLIAGGVERATGVPVAALSNAIAFATRGTSITIVGFRDSSATTPDKPAGRIHRGVELFTLTVNVGTALTTTQELSGFTVNGPFVMGHAIYAFKHAREAVTGKELVPNAGDVGLAAYLVGSVPYAGSAMSNLSSPGMDGARAWVDAFAGGAFIVGSAGLWRKTETGSFVSGWAGAWLQDKIGKTRAERLADWWPLNSSNKEKDGAADTQKEKADWFTIVTYGGGLMLFSASAILTAIMKSREREPDIGESSSDDEKDMKSPDVPMIREPEPRPQQQPHLQPESWPERLPEPPWVPLVVSEPTGLNLRNAPSGEAPVISAIPYGNFLRELESWKIIDDQGNEWIKVRSFPSDNGSQEGWVMAEHVSEQDVGAMAEDGGRLNPELEGNHTVVIAEPNQSMGGIALREGYGVMEVVELNMAHIVDPNVIYPRDRIYLPERVKVS